jgi:N-hydroxyarylamine O-acetyltransferase
MTGHPWQIERLDLDAYLARIGVSGEPPSRSALDRLLGAHVRTFTFDNIDVLLEQHPGVGLDAVQSKFVGRGRGGYCFEHGTLFAAAVERLGYTVERRLGRVGDPTQKARTHTVVVVTLGDQRLLCDPGFGVSTLRTIPLLDNVEDDYGGRTLRVREVREGAGRAWELHRRGEDGWELAHTHDELPVRPVDVVHGHHYTSTFPSSIFRQMLMVAGHAGDRHLTLTESTVTVRRAGAPTEHREITVEELPDLLHELNVPLTDDELERLLKRLAEL